MDWARAKTILILALVLTNLFLLFMILSNTRDAEGFSDQAALIEILGKQDITLNTEIPGGTPEIAPLTVKYRTSDSTMQDMFMGMSRHLEPDADEGEYREVAESVIEKCGFDLSGLRYQGMENESGLRILNYGNSANGIALDESYIRCVFEEGAFIDMQYRWLEASSVSVRKMQVISASAALITFMGERSQGEPILVEEISLVYLFAGDSEDAEQAVSGTAIPVWKITYNGEHTAYIAAYEE